MPLLPANSCETGSWDVHTRLRLDHKSPHKSALEASYTLWVEPPRFCCPNLHQRKVLMIPK